MGYYSLDPCICGDYYYRHNAFGRDSWGTGYPDGCGIALCSCKEFKLDNLSYIENLAKEKNLI
jgi:hypothetical protein